MSLNTAVDDEVRDLRHQVYKLRVRNSSLRSRLWEEKDRLESAILRRVMLDEAITRAVDGEEYLLLKEMHPRDSALVALVESLVSRKDESRGGR